jgi:hypothetical protein
VGVILLPVAGISNAAAARTAFGLGALLFIGQSLGLAGHYQLYNLTKHRKFVWFPTQEKIVVTLTILAGFVYCVLAFFKA